MRSLAIALSLLITAAPAAAAEYDVVIRHARVLDGAKNPWVAEDVAVKDGRIAKVGMIPGRGAREIDAKGRYLAPGFIDMMDQSGEAMLHPGAGENKLRQGITTIIAGEGGTPVDADKLAGYFDQLQRQGIALNFGTSYSVAQPRMRVMGDKAGAPTPAQLAAMKAEVATAMKAGAFGVTSALIYPPMSYMSTAEITELAKPAGACGGFYSTHMRDEGEHLLDAIDEAVAIGEGSGAKVEIYHLKAAWAPLWGKLMPQALDRIAAARERGVDVAADMYVYPAGGTELAITVPNWVWADGRAKGRERLRDPQVRARLKREVAAGNLPGWSNLVAGGGGWSGVMLANANSPRWDKYNDMRISEIAAAEHRDPADIAWDIVLDSVSSPPNAGALGGEDRERAFALYFTNNEGDIATALRAPFTGIGSDAAATITYGGLDAIGLAHPRSYGNAVRVIAEFVKRRHVLTLEQAVGKMTGWASDRLGLADRGLIREGLRADLVVFDLDRLDDVASWRTPTASPSGIDYVLVNGQLALDGGRMTGARAGQVLRHECSAK